MEFYCILKRDENTNLYVITRWSQWPRGLRRRSAVARWLGLWVRIPPGVWMSVSCVCCVLSGRSLRRADPSSKGVLPTSVRPCVWWPSPVRGGQDPESGRSTTGKKIIHWSTVSFYENRDKTAFLQKIGKLSRDKLRIQNKFEMYKKASKRLL